jgi:hypothetical protein
MRIRTYAAISLFAVFGAIGVYLVFTKLWQPWEKESDARKQLAFVSLMDRLPKGKPITPGRPLDAEAKKRWQEMDDSLVMGEAGHPMLLKALHEKTRRFFVESPGAGSERGRLPSEDEILLDNWHGDGDASQTGQPADFPDSPSELLTRVQPDSEWHSFHKVGMHNFLFPTGFGYVKDRQNVAGFKPHGFRYLGYALRDHKQWRVQHILLVGILTQDQPVVYLTDKLPSMEQIRQGKVRPLDLFEEAGMPSLRDGEDLYIVRKDDTVYCQERRYGANARRVACDENVPKVPRRGDR